MEGSSKARNLITSDIHKSGRTPSSSNESRMIRSIWASLLLPFCLAYSSCGGSGQSPSAPGTSSSVLNDYHLAGATSPVRDPSYYYLFVSFDDCCNPDPYKDTYRIMVGRGSSPHGPFSDMNGTDMMQGGGTQLIAGNGATWNAPGGETVYLDPQKWRPDYIPCFTSSRRWRVRFRELTSMAKRMAANSALIPTRSVSSQLYWRSKCILENSFHLSFTLARLFSSG